MQVYLIEISTCTEKRKKKIIKEKTRRKTDHGVGTY
jgi:hypothetical protein